MLNSQVCGDWKYDCHYHDPNFSDDGTGTAPPGSTGSPIPYVSGYVSETINPGQSDEINPDNSQIYYLKYSDSGDCRLSFISLSNDFGMPFVQSGSDKIASNSVTTTWNFSSCIKGVTCTVGSSSSEFKMTIHSGADFKLDCTQPSSPMMAGKTSQTTCTVTSTGTFNGPVDLSCTAPDKSKITCGFNPDQVTPPPTEATESTLVISTDAGSPAGSYDLTIKGTSGEGTSGSISHDTTVTVKVEAPSIEVVLDKEEITPYLGQVPFGSIIPIPGQSTQLSGHTMPAVDGGETQVTATISGIQDVSNIPITLTFEPVLGTGGHDHLTSITDTVQNAFGGFVTTSGDTQLSDSGNTDSDGAVKSTFKAINLNDETKNSASGEVKITATAKVGDKTITDTKTLAIKIAGLAALGSGDGYQLVGACPGQTDKDCSNHLDNHYSLPSVDTALQSIATAYHNKHPNSILRYNDQSLQWGGLFDIHGNWLNPHLSHACGTDADIGFKDTNEHPVVAADLAKFASQSFPGAFVIVENVGTTNAHYHIHFADC